MQRVETVHPSLGARLQRWWGKGELGPGPLSLLMVLPALVFLLGIIAYPVLYALYLSFHEATLKGLASGVMPFVGLKNYLTLFRDPVFRMTMRHSAEFVGLSVLLEVTLGMLIALVLNDRSTKLGRFNKSIMLLPWAVAPIANGLMWQYIYNPSFGYLNVVLYKLGIISEFRQFAGDSQLAMLAVVLAFVWRVTPFSVLLFHSALQGVPEELYDAAKVDGCGAIQRFRHVTLPLIRPTLTIVLVLRTAFAFMVFDEIFAITAGGPGDRTWVASWYTYQHAFRYLEMGVGSAMAFIMAGVIAVVTLVYILLIYRKIEYA
ncbi:MAG: sugar ABC transporter permease [Chloroflexi bacterium]|nr:sugar ABC transporter permease [Chloroflexota bacterium]